MAKQVISLAYLLVNSVDLSGSIRNVTLSYEADAVDSTTMGLTTKTALGGLKNWSIQGTFAQDYAAGSVDATLFSLVGATFALEARASSAAVAVTNPKFTGTGLLTSYTPIAGGVGDLQETPFTIVASSALTRATV